MLPLFCAVGTSGYTYATDLTSFTRKNHSHFQFCVQNYYFFLIYANKLKKNCTFNADLREYITRRIKSGSNEHT